jgi:hypothetical protein
MDRDSEIKRLRFENKKIKDELQARDESHTQLERNKKAQETELLAEIA